MKQHQKSLNRTVKRLAQNEIRLRGRVERFFLRLRWWVARPVMGPILDDMDVYAKNLRGCVLLKGTPEILRYAYNEKADTIGGYKSQIERAFGLRPTLEEIIAGEPDVLKRKALRESLNES